MQGKKRRERGRPRATDPREPRTFSIRHSVLDEFSAVCGVRQSLSMSGHAEKALQMYLNSKKKAKNNLPNIENTHS